MTRATALLAALGLVVMGAGSAFAAEGDYNGDGAVDAADQQMLVDAIGTVEGDDGYLAAGDHDGDGVISLQDVGYFLTLGN
jgi:hypothetical protein